MTSGAWSWEKRWRRNCSPGDDMDQETFNLSIRKFLKMVGVNSQREIEQAVQKAMMSGKLQDRKSTRLNSSHPSISYAVFCLKKKKKSNILNLRKHNTHT